MVEVRKHQRRTASGKLTTVRRHTRDAGGSHPPGTWYGRDDDTGLVFAVHPDGERELLPAEEAEGFQPIVPSGPPPAAPVQVQPEEFWDDDPEPAGEWWDRDGDAPTDPPVLAEMKQEMRDWRALGEPEPPPMEPMDPGKAALLGCDTPEGMARFQRLAAYREAGYTGPLDRDNQIPDPDDPANQEWLNAGAALRETHTPAPPEPGAAAAYREAGYDGPVDQDGNPTDLKALKKARKKIERERRHVQFKFMQAPTRAERDAVQEEDRPLAAKLKVLEDPRERRRQERARQARKDLYQKLS